MCEDTFVVHIEKAFADVDGAYPMINQQFVQHECTDYAYINREDDAGSAGLRKAKLSYQPAFMVQKGFGSQRNRGYKDDFKKMEKYVANSSAINDI